MTKFKESWWEKRNNLERILIVIITLLLCFVLSLVIVLIINNRYFQNTEETVTSCTTTECIKLSSEIINFIDPSVDPCDNFYNFACGTYFKKSTKKIDKLKIENQIDAIITEPTNEKFPKSIELQRQFYSTCTNTTGDNEEVMLNIIEEVTGGWPVRRGTFWNKQKFHWLNAIIKSRKLGIDFEFFLKIKGEEVNVNGTEMMLLSIGPPEITDLPSHLRDYYIDLMTIISVNLGSISYEEALNAFVAALSFKEQISIFSKDEESYGNEEIIQVKDLQEKFPRVRWIEFLNSLTITSPPFTNDTWIHFRVTRYLQNLQLLLDQTAKTTQANYIIWHMIESLGVYFLDGPVGEQYVSFLTSLNPSLDVNDRDNFCLGRARFYFPSVAEVAYVRKSLHPDARTEIKLLVKSIKKNLLEKLEKIDWLDEKSRKVSEIKLNEIEEIVGASDEVFEENFDKIVQMDEFDFENDNIIEMITQLYAKKMDNYFKNINKKLREVKKEILRRFPILNTNLPYNIKDKTLVLPTPLLVEGIYSHHYPWYAKYGAIGGLIGHELIKLAFQEDKSKTLDFSWSSISKKKYEENIKCLEDSTTTYEEELEDNFQAFAGINLAYQAYQQWVIDHFPEKNPPGLAYTRNQTFWITFAMSTCYQHGRQKSRSLTVTTLKNSPDFSVDFNCSRVSKRKCEAL